MWAGGLGAVAVVGLCVFLVGRNDSTIPSATPGTTTSSEVQTAVDTDVEIQTTTTTASPTTASPTTSPTTTAKKRTTTTFVVVDEDAVRRFARKAIDAAWVEFFKTLQPDPLARAKESIMKRFPGVDVWMNDSGAMELSGAVSMCFAPNYARPTGPGMVVEVPCD